MSTPSASASPAVLVSTCAAMLTIVGVLVGLGVWKGGVDEKVNNFGVRLDKGEARLAVVEAEAHTAVQNSQFIIQQLAQFRGEAKEQLEQFRGETKARMDRQMERLDKLSDRAAIPAAPAHR